MLKHQYLIYIALSFLYDEAKVDELENADELSGKDKVKLENYIKKLDIITN